MESDTDVSDEDVLFENSPLYQHLLETGVQVENISTAINSTSCKETRENCDSEADSRQHLVKAGIAHRCAECFIDIFTTLLGRNQLKTELKQMKLFYGTKILQESLKHDMLEEDDKNYLEHFSGLKSQQHQQGKRDPALVSKIILMFGIPILVSYFCGRLMWPSYPWKYKGISDALSVVTAVYFLLLIGKALYLARHKWALEGILQEVTEMLGAGREFFRMTGKCLRLIQETELVARGFTLVSQKSPLCRMEQNGMLGYQRQCPQLRQQLFVLCRDRMITSKNWTSQLLARDPIPAERSFNFLANIPLEEYGPCLQIKGENSESHKHLEEITDGFSISAIKGVNQVCRLQYSELCRSFILRVLQSLESNNFKGDFPKTQDIQDRLELSTKELGTLHAYFDSVSNPSETLPQKQDLSKMNDLDIAVHSLDLHLQAALLRVRKLSVLTKHLTNEDTENEHTTKSNHNQSMETMLDQVKQELLACKGCWEEGLERLQKLYKHQTSQVEKPEEDKKPMVHTPIPVDTPPVDLFNTGPPIIQDEVFEAYIDKENDAEGPDYSWDEYLSPEEKERKKKEKQEALRLLTELKSVISVRAEEMGRREKIAKERKYGPETCEDKNIGKPAEKVCDQHINENDENSLHKELISQDNLRHLTVDPSQNNSRLSSEQFKTKVLDDDDDESERGPIEDQERDSMEGGRMFITGTDDDSTDCSLRSFPHLVPREGVLPIQSPSFQFSSNLAAMAVARSRDFGLSEDTFGDSESDSDQRSETSSPLN